MFSILFRGSFGGTLLEKRCMTMQLSSEIIVDTGAVLAKMTVEEILKLEHIVITHAHFDHIKDLAGIADIFTSKGKGNLVIHSTKYTANLIKKHLFNNTIWPDFTQIPSKQNPAVRFEYFEEDKFFKIGKYSFLPIEVNHSIESMGFIISKDNRSFAYSGDTAISQNFIDKIKSAKNLVALFWEVSFPNRMEKIAISSGHLTPKMFKEELQKINLDIPVYIFHIKPGVFDETLKEINEIKNFNINIVEQDKIMDI